MKIVKKPGCYHQILHKFRSKRYYLTQCFNVILTSIKLSKKYLRKISDNISIIFHKSCDFFLQRKIFELIFISLSKKVRFTSLLTEKCNLKYLSAFFTIFTKIILSHSKNPKKYTLLFMSNNFISNIRLKLGKDQANDKQHSQAEL